MLAGLFAGGNGKVGLVVGPDLGIQYGCMRQMPEKYTGGLKRALVIIPVLGFRSFIKAGLGAPKPGVALNIRFIGSYIRNFVYYESGGLPGTMGETLPLPSHPALKSN